jgi:peptidyl-prolyl cis-trans isomerase B (cyclophilin B)
MSFNLVRDLDYFVHHISAMKNLIAVCMAVLALGFTSLGADAEKKADKSEAKSGKAAGTNEVAIIKTSAGEMVIEFWPDVAPKTVENFKKLAREKFYDGTAFHRIIKGFMIQGGDPLTKDASAEDRWGTGDPGYKINAEFNDHPHVLGVISMARSADPNSAGSQFFICLGPAPFLDHKYTAFGKVIKGEDVLTKLGDSPVKGNRGEVSRPTTRVALESVRIVPASSSK